MTKLDQIIKQIANLRVDMKDLTVEVRGLKNAMENFSQDMTKSQENFVRELEQSQENFTLAMELRFARFQFAVVVTMILTGVSMVFLWWGLNKLFGGN